MRLAFEDFGADVWRADALGQAVDATVGTGHPLLDAELPGGGWPVGALTEILQNQSGQHEWRLLLPALNRTELGRVVALVGAPHVPFGPGLLAQGLDARRLLAVPVDSLADRLWATEQALRCAEVAAVLAWLPQVRGAHLRRLQMAASQHRKLLFVMRPDPAQGESSPAVLRVRVAGLHTPAGALQLEILKRRGPPLASALVLPLRHAPLAVRLALGPLYPAGPRELPGWVPLPSQPRLVEGGDALDRLAAAA
jgi:protein ImuA